MRLKDKLCFVTGAARGLGAATPPPSTTRRPEEIANVNALLVSEEASCIKGAVIKVPGGMTV